MFVETEAIPYEPSDLKGERLLVLAPHPDDEVIGCGGVVAQHLQSGRAVTVVIATDGGGAGDSAGREAESLRGLAKLGAPVDVRFLRFADRSLGDDAASPLREILASVKPDLVLVPSPIEIHPDHFALSRIVCELVQRDETLFAELAFARVAFYEVGQPIRPNAIVDITDVAELKYAAIAEHTSQLETRDYVGFARGLNAYRTMTMPPAVRFAEAYYVMPLPELRTLALSQLRVRVGSAPAIETAPVALPVSVVVRTKDRPALLAEAIASVRATGYPCEIVVVNDGGAAPELPADVRLVTHRESLGRSQAANSGVREARNPFVVFLDDDDLFYEEHLSTLAAGWRTGAHAAVYTDAVSAFMRIGESGEWTTRARLRLYANDFDRQLLLADNYIPLPALLLERAVFLELGGFDPAFDLFEDWDFLIRLSRRGSFLRVPKVTCEVRHFEGGSSAVLAAPSDSPAFRDAKIQVWRKHADIVSESTFVAVLEMQKKRIAELYSRAVESAGALDRAEIEIARSSRQLVESQNAINGYMLAERELHGRIEALGQSLEQTLRTASIDRERAEASAIEVERLHHELSMLHAVHEQSSHALQLSRVEIQRLNGLLEMIYGSKTWKLHTLLEKARGRG